MILDGENEIDRRDYLAMVKFAPDTKVWVREKGKTYWAARWVTARPLNRMYDYAIGEEKPNDT